ncbi:hypothetical protein GT204_12030 [Streptomyces sp. SID4919]|uniref:effector-associated constant component EACC1 n=1 Tax=unclassified Streptomyces TaxID=2593676 RepID=UPI000C087E8D|nr:hypothetical protein [Streptomyces sp. AmelKG-E11A]MYY09621.1 hypothetical protein [Streptomyces sp. SID4919]
MGPLVELAVKIDCGKHTEDELRSLHAWLLSDPMSRRHARPVLTSSHEPRPGAQGEVLDVVALLVGGGFSAASLVVSILTWRGTRVQEPTVTVERRDGTNVTISGTSPQEAARIADLLTTGQEDGRGDTT